MNWRLLRLAYAFTYIGNANRRAGGRRNRDAAFLHKLLQERFGFWMRDRGLDAHSN